MAAALTLALLPLLLPLLPFIAIYVAIWRPEAIQELIQNIKLIPEYLPILWEIFRGLFPF